MVGFGSNWYQMRRWVLAWMCHMAAFGSNWYQMHRWVLAWRWHMVGFGSNCYHIHTISSRTRCRGAATLPACSLLRLAKKYREDKYDDCATITAHSAKKKTSCTSFIRLSYHHLSICLSHALNSRPASRTSSDDAGDYAVPDLKK